VNTSSRASRKMEIAEMSFEGLSILMTRPNRGYETGKLIRISSALRGIPINALTACQWLQIRLHL
jgi:hypothetical protein